MIFALVVCSYENIISDVRIYNIRIFGILTKMKAVSIMINNNTHD